MSNYRNTKIDQYSRKFAALSNPNRARIFLRLASCCALSQEKCSPEEMRTCVGDLGKYLRIAPSTVSHHIKELHRAGLVKMERVGRTALCCVEPHAIKELTDFLGAALSHKPAVSSHIRKNSPAEEEGNDERVER